MYWFAIAALFSVTSLAGGDEDIFLKPIDDNPVSVSRELANQMSVIAGAIDFGAEQAIPVQIHGAQLRELIEVMADPAQLEQIANLAPLIRAADILGADTILERALDLHGERLFSDEAMQQLQTMRQNPQAYAEYKRAHLDALAPGLQQRIIMRRLQRFGLVQENVVAGLVHELPRMPRTIVKTAILSPDGRYVATASGEARDRRACQPMTICFWILEPGQNPIRLQLESLGRESVGLEFSPDGRWLVAKSLEGLHRSRVWSVDQLADLNPVPALECETVAFSSCARYVSAWSSHGRFNQIRVWRAPDFPGYLVIFADMLKSPRNFQLEIDGENYVIRYYGGQDFRRGYEDGTFHFTGDDSPLPSQTWGHGSFGIRPYVDRYGVHHCREWLRILTNGYGNANFAPLFALYRDLNGDLETTRDGNLVLQIRGHEVHVIEVPQARRVTTLAAAQMLHFRGARLAAICIEEVLPLHFEDAIDESPYARLLVGELPRLVRILRPLPLFSGILAFIVSRRGHP